MKETDQNKEERRLEDLEEEFEWANKRLMALCHELRGVANAFEENWRVWLSMKAKVVELQRMKTRYDREHKDD